MELSFEKYLKQEFEKRHAKNPSYSLRAFARLVNHDPSSLAKIIAGQRSVRPALAKKLGEKLGVPTEVLEKFTLLAPFDARNKEVQLDYEPLEWDLFQMITEWHHDAILLLSEVDGFTPSEDWVAKKLGISTEQVRLALGRLSRLGLIKLNPGGGWEVTTTAVTTLNSPLSTTEFLKKGQEQMLERSIDALQHLPLEERDHSSIAFAFQRADLPRVREYIKRFRRRLDGLAAKAKRKDSVYALTISFFPLTKNKTQGAENE